MPLLAYDDADKPFLSVPAAALVASIALLVGVGGGVLVAGRTDDPGRSSTTGQSSGGRRTLPSGCPVAVASADAALAEAGQVDAALAAQTQVMNDLMAHRITAEQAVRLVAPALTSGARHSVALDVATQRYRAAAAGCRP